MMEYISYVTSPMDVSAGHFILTDLCNMLIEFPCIFGPTCPNAPWAHMHCFVPVTKIDLPEVSSCFKNYSSWGHTVGQRNYFTTSIAVLYKLPNAMNKPFVTRQLPIGAGHCQWSGLTDQNIPNIRPLGPLAAAGERLTYGRMES